MFPLWTNEQTDRMLPNNIRHRNPLVQGRGSRPAPAAPTEDGASAWRVLRVLIVDDEQDRLGGLLALINASGHDARKACHGRAAFILAADEHPDIVLLNLELSSADGRHLARQLRSDAQRPDCLIIAVAEWADNERRQQCGDAGIDLLFVESLDPSVLEMLLWLECLRTNRRRVRVARTTNYEAHRSESC